MSKLTLLYAIAASMLAGCESGMPPTPEPRYPTPANLTAPCPELPLATSGVLHALLTNHVEVAGLYHDCRDRQRALAETVRLHEFLQEGVK